MYLSQFVRLNMDNESKSMKMRCQSIERSTITHQKMTIISTILLAMHISGGMTALLAGLIPMFAEKGSRTHIIGGKVYLWAMWIAVFSALPLALLKMNLFLGTIGIFTAYMVYTGNRAAQRKSAVPSSRLDLVVMWGTMVVSLLMVGMAIYLAVGSEGRWPMGLVLGTFGGFCFLLTLEDRRYALHPERFPRKAWLLMHLRRFGGAYIATFTAFVVTNVTFVPGLLLWLGPGIIGGMILGRTASYWRQRLNIN